MNHRMPGSGLRLPLVLLAVLVPMMTGALWMIFLYAPEERVMGAAQKIFYFHVPLVLATYLGVAVLLAGSIGYLWSRDMRWDHVSRAATELGLLFCGLALVSGSIWAKPAWGVWWTWEARLTSTLILWLLLAGCLLVRSYASTRELGARLAAVVGIVAALDVPIIHKAVDWWRGQHPVVFAPGKKETMAEPMLRSFQLSIVVFLVLFVLLLLVRYRIALAEDRARAVLERTDPADDLEGGLP